MLVIMVVSSSQCSKVWLFVVPDAKCCGGSELEIHAKEHSASAKVLLDSKFATITTPTVSMHDFQVLGH